MTTLPTWLVVAGALAPLIAAAVVLVGHLISRKGSTELDNWRRREETLRMLRWGAEKAVDADVRVSEMGIAALTALSQSEMLQSVDDLFVDLVLAAVVDEPVSAYREFGGSARVVTDGD